MKWFGRKGAPRARPLLFSGWRHLFAAEPWPRSYEAQVREAYLANPIAQRAVRLVAESVAWAPVFAQVAPPPSSGRSPSPAKAGEDLDFANADTNRLSAASAARRSR